MSEVTFTVTSVNRTREWVDGHGGSNTSYYVSQDLNDLEVEIAQRAIKDPVRVGQRWKGTVVPRTYNQETFYKLQDKQLVGGGAPPSQGFDVSQSAPAASNGHPVDSTDQRIQRQWALKAALSLAAEARERGVTVEQLLTNIRQLADKLEAELIVNRPTLPSLAGSETAAQAEGVISEPPPPSAALEASEASW